MVLVPDGHESMPRVITHSNSNHHSASRFPYKHTVAPDTLTCINALLGCFPERTVTIDVESTITYQLNMLVLLLCSLA